MVAFRVAALALLAIAGWLFAKKFGITLNTRDAVGIVMLALFLLAATRRRKDLIPYFAFACAAIELFTFNMEFNALASEHYYRMRLPIIDALHRMAPAEPFRIVGFDWVLTPNAAMQYDVEDIRGSDPMEFGPYYDFFHLVEAPSSTDVKRIQDIEQPGIAFLNVRYVLTEPGFGTHPGWQQRYAGPDGELYESLTVLPRFFIPARIDAGPSTTDRLRAIASFADTVIVDGFANGVQPGGAHVSKIAQNRTGTLFTFNVDAPQPVLVASSQPFTPGWEIWLNGRRAHGYRVNKAFIGFVAPTGHTEVVIRYRPRSVTASLWIAGLTLLICLGALIAHSNAARRADVPAA
jgi:hypothetical protein